MAKITIKYTQPIEDEILKGACICRHFQPDNCAADNACFDGTEYDNAPDGYGEPARSIDEYVEKSVAHPGLVAALKAAIRDGQYELADADDKAVLYAGELKGALADQGFEITVE